MEGEKEGQGRLLGGGHRDEHAQLVLFSVRRKKTRGGGLGLQEVGLKMGLATSATRAFFLFFFCLLLPVSVYRNQNIMILEFKSLANILLNFSLYLKYDLQIFPNIILGFHFNRKEREMYLFFV